MSYVKRDWLRLFKKNDVPSNETFYNYHEPQTGGIQKRKNTVGQQIKTAPKKDKI